MPPNSPELNCGLQRGDLRSGLRGEHRHAALVGGMPGQQGAAWGQIGHGLEDGNYIELDVDVYDSYDVYV